MPFRQHARRVIATLAHRLAVAGMTTLGVAIAAMLLLNFDVVLGRTPASFAAGLILVFVTSLWAGLPGIMRAKREH